MASPNLQLTDIQSGQSQPEVPANAQTHGLDRAQNSSTTKAITGSGSFTTTETRENFLIELTGTPGSPFTVNMPDANKRTLAVLNSTNAQATIRNSAGAGAGQPVLAVGRLSLFHYDGTDFEEINEEAAVTVLPEQVEFSVIGAPAISSIVGIKIASVPFTLDQNLAGGRAYANSGPNGGSPVFDIRKNGDSIGTVTFADSTGAPQTGTFSPRATYAQRKLILPFDGADGAVSALDYSASPHTLTFIGNAQLDTAQKKFGTASLLLDGTGDRISLADSADWTPGANEAFTIHAWVRRAVAGAEHNIISHYNATTSARSWRFKIVTSNVLGFTYSLDGVAATVISSTGTITDTNWHHVAVTRDASGNIRLFIDGTLDGSGVQTGAFFNSDRLVFIGAEEDSSPQNHFNGHIDELEFIKGAALWTASFTPPTRGLDLLGRELLAAGDVLTLVSPGSIASMADMAVNISATRE